MWTEAKITKLPLTFIKVFIEPAQADEFSEKGFKLISIEICWQL
jgi:hypothetical protein